MLFLLYAFAASEKHSVVYLYADLIVCFQIFFFYHIQDVEIYGWGDYLEQIKDTISDVIEKVKVTGENLWDELQNKGKEIIEKAKASLVSSEDAATAFLNDVYPSVRMIEINDSLL